MQFCVITKNELSTVYQYSNIGGTVVAVNCGRVRIGNVVLNILKFDQKSRAQSGYELRRTKEDAGGHN